MTVPVLATSSVMVSVEWEMVHPQGDCTCVGYFQCDGECGMKEGLSAKVTVPMSDTPNMTVKGFICVFPHMISFLTWRLKQLICVYCRAFFC